MSRQFKFRAWVDYTDGWDMISPQEVAEEFTIQDLMEESTLVKFMQWTGLKDKNGVEIYEGDIIGAGFAYDYQIINEDGHVRAFYDSKAVVDKQLLFQNNLNENGYEVIGNIYENPELLEEAE